MEVVYGLFLSVFVPFFLHKVFEYFFPGALYWVWDNAGDNVQTKRVKIDIDKELQFPKGFLWGTATAAHQVEGNCNNNQWFEWENGVNDSGNSRIKNGDKSGFACEHWERFPQDVALMKDLGCNSYRFSLEWSKIQPSKDVWDKKVIEHYRDVLTLLKMQDIVPMITLHHFTNPIWFENLGGWEREENIFYFVNFCEFVFKEFSSYCRLWCTINEPEMFAFSGYLAGVFPPGKKDYYICGKVLFHLLEAHVRVYKKLKSLKGGELAQIGIVKDIFQFDPKTPWSPFDIVVAKGVDNLMNVSILEFFRTGIFHWYMLGIVNLKCFNIDAIASNDFLGLNYYSHYHVRFVMDIKQPFRIEHKLSSIATDMSYPLYPEGIYRAIMRLVSFKLPIYITENGIADAVDDRRAMFIRKYLYAVSKAIKDGANVVGYYYWTLLDNFEWAEGYSMKFGLYSVDFKTQERTLRDGSKHLQNIIKRFNFA